VEDFKIGHTYFLGDFRGVALKFRYQVIPIIDEYLKDGIFVNEEPVEEVFKNFFGVEDWRNIPVQKIVKKLND